MLEKQDMTPNLTIYQGIARNMQVRQETLSSEETQSTSFFINPWNHDNKWNPATRDFFFQFWQGALGPFRLGKLAW